MTIYVKEKNLVIEAQKLQIVKSKNVVGLYSIIVNDEIEVVSDIKESTAHFLLDRYTKDIKALTIFPYIPKNEKDGNI